MPSQDTPRAQADSEASPANAADPQFAAHSKEQLAAHLFDLSPIPAVFSRLEDSTILAMNARTSEIFGVAQERAAGLRGADFYVDLAQRADLINRLRRDGRADNVRIHLRRGDGSTLWAQASARLVSYGGTPAVLTVFNDISEQVAAESALRESEARLQAQTNALTDLTARYADLASPFDERLRTILTAAARALRVERLSMWRFDETRREIRCVDLYQCCLDQHQAGAIIPRDAVPAYFAALERERVIAAADAIADARTREFVDTYLRPNGIGAMLDVPLRQNKRTIGVLCAEHVGGPRPWTIDEQNFAIASANLISMAIADEERRDALERLAESNARAQLVVDTAHDAFIGVDSSNGIIVTWNAQAEKTFGWSADEAVGANLVDTIIPAAYREAHLQGMRRFHETGEAHVLNQRLELTALHKDGREFPIEITITSPIHTRDGYFFGAFLRDISDRRERDAQLRLAKESAEAATRAKSEFLANMSHELRTPLNGVLGYAQLLHRDRNLTPAQRESLDAIAKCGSHLLDLINDILDLSKIEAGFLDIESVTTDLAQLAIDLRYVVGEAARRKSLLLTMSIAPDVPRRVVLDGRHLRQVLLNLLGNAIKFTTRGEVALRMTRSEDERLLFEVSDTGIGIESEALAQIFEAFTQTEAGAAAGGTGLGLAISHHLIMRMGDELRVESTPGRGSRFYFALPLIAAPDADLLPTDGVPADTFSDARLAPGEEITALVVDDSTVNRRILAALLESAGARVITAAGGMEAIRLVQEHRPDVVFMDLKMSDLDGLEATRRIAADPATAHIPVIAVTASTLGDRRQAARDAGCVDYLAKPVRAELLFAALQTHLNVRFVSASAVESVQPPVALTVGPQHKNVANRLRESVAIGDVTDLHALAQELVAGDAREAALGQRVGRLLSDFDFDGLRELAASLSLDAGEPA